MAGPGNVSTFLRANALGIGCELLINIVLPFVIYAIAAPKFGDIDALLASSAPPIVWSIGEFARKRRIDAFSIFILAGIGLSLLAFIGGGSARFLQLRENLVTAIIGLGFLISAAIGKPLIYELARATMLRKSATEAENFVKLRDNVSFRRTMIVITVVWGVGLLAQTAIACILVLRLSIAQYLIVSPIAGYGFLGGLGVWTYWYSQRQKRLGAQRRAQADRPAPKA